ncbi:MAG: DUF1294 domain-containing protein [Eubacteriales bacterium]|nr:DUF1294 domain-containing protein [Eubacteriales bacterium]
MTYLQMLFLVDAALMVLMSFISLCLFIADKRKAEKGAMRIREKTLLYSAVLEGAVGAFFGRILAHHKTNKGYFTFVIFTSLVLQVGVLVFLGVMAF